MSAEPTIRDEWVEAGVAALVAEGCVERGGAFIRDNVYVEGAVTVALTAVAPLIQAAALRDLADEFETTAIQIVFDDPKSIDATRWDGMETSRKHAIRQMRDRADRIGGGGSDA